MQDLHRADLIDASWILFWESGIPGEILVEVIVLYCWGIESV